MHLTVGLIHALPVHERRVYNRQEAASYVGVSPGHFKKLVDDGVMPAPLAAYGRARRWDKAALEQALYSASGAGGSTALGAYDQWRNARGQG
jgi:excisionase family DNA binding protein